MKTPFLIGQKIYLRPLERDDAVVLREYINDAEVLRTLGMHRPSNLEANLAVIDRFSPHPDSLRVGIVLKENDRLIGATNLRLSDAAQRAAMFGISIGAKAEWNKGYGTEATRLMVRHGFETLNLNRIALTVYEFNPRGMRAYEKAGFRREAVLRQEVYSQGRFWDVYMMGILRADWDALRASA